jgi:Tat protein secretion system quality control protein TatD with DNase activity
MIGRPVPDVLAEARAAGIERVITVGTDLESSRWSAR